MHSVNIIEYSIKNWAETIISQKFWIKFYAIISVFSNVSKMAVFQIFCIYRIFCILYKQNLRNSRFLTQKYIFLVSNQTNWTPERMFLACFVSFISSVIFSRNFSKWLWRDNFCIYGIHGKNVRRNSRRNTKMRKNWIAKPQIASYLSV